MDWGTMFSFVLAYVFLVVMFYHKWKILGEIENKEKRGIAKRENLMKKD